MIEVFSQNPWFFWVGIYVVCLLLELASGGIYLTCFAIGALASTIASAFRLPFWVQVTVWAVCSMLSIWLIRPRVLRFLHEGADGRSCSSDSLLGQVGRVTETIVAGGYGRVKLDGEEDWKVQAPTAQEDIEVGAKVRVVGIESIILRVERV